MQFEQDLDPFLLSNDHSAVKLQLTKRAIKDWILTHRINSIKQEIRLTKIWKQLIIRRTSQSRISFRTDIKIVDSLSRVKTVIISCFFNNKE